jgi:ribosomal protein S18 acetylase RimI-like enzyme
MDIKKIKKLTEDERIQIKKLLESLSWNANQVQGQLDAIDRLLGDAKGIVFFAFEKGRVIGYISAEFHLWNRLGQIHGLVIHPEHRKKGIASLLVKEVEIFMTEHSARGVYVDTPTNNTSGCAFYIKNAFQSAYVMPEYYDVGLDGVTFLKFFR